MGEPVKGSKICISLKPLKQVAGDNHLKNLVSLRGIDPEELFQMENSSGEICSDEYRPAETSGNFVITFKQLSRKIDQIEGELKAREQNSNIKNLKSEEICKKTTELINNPFIDNKDPLVAFLSRAVLGAYACQGDELISLVDLLIDKKFGGHKIVDITLTLPEDKSISRLKRLLETGDAKFWAGQKIKDFIENCSNSKRYDYLVEIAAVSPKKAAELAHTLPPDQTVELFKEIEKKEPETVMAYIDRLPANARFEFFMNAAKTCPAAAARHALILTEDNMLEIFREIEKRDAKAVIEYSNYLPEESRIEFFINNYKKHPSTAVTNIYKLPKNRRFEFLKLVYRTADLKTDVIDYIMRSLRYLQNDDERLYFFHEELEQKTEANRYFIFTARNMEYLEKEESRFIIFKRMMSNFDVTLRTSAMIWAERLFSSDLCLIGIYSLGLTDPHNLVRREAISKITTSRIPDTAKKILLEIAVKDPWKDNMDKAQSYLQALNLRGI